MLNSHEFNICPKGIVKHYNQKRMTLEIGPAKPPSQSQKAEFFSQVS